MMINLDAYNIAKPMVCLGFSHCQRCAWHQWLSSYRSEDQDLNAVCIPRPQRSSNDSVYMWILEVCPVVHHLTVVDSQASS